MLHGIPIALIKHFHLLLLNTAFHLNYLNREYNTNMKKILVLAFAPLVLAFNITKQEEVGAVLPENIKQADLKKPSLPKPRGKKPLKRLLPEKSPSIGRKQALNYALKSAEENPAAEDLSFLRNFLSPNLASSIGKQEEAPQELQSSYKDEGVKEKLPSSSYFMGGYENRESKNLAKNAEQALAHGLATQEKEEKLRGAAQDSSLRKIEETLAELTRQISSISGNAVAQKESEVATKKGNKKTPPAKKYLPKKPRGLSAIGGQGLSLL